MIGQNTGLIPVPSSANRAGDVSDMADQLTKTVSGSYFAGILTQKLGYAVAAGEPYYTASCASTAACVFPGAVVPASAIDPITPNLLKYIPTANSGSNYTTSADNLVNNDNMGAFNIDWVRQSNTVTGYYYQNGSGGISPYASASFPGFENLVAALSKMINLGDTKTFGSNKLNEARILYFQYQTQNALEEAWVRRWPPWAFQPDRMEFFRRMPLWKECRPYR